MSRSDDDLRGILRQNTLLLIQHERELLAMRQGKSRAVAWLNALHDLSRGTSLSASIEQICASWADALLGELGFQVAGCLRFDRSSRTLTPIVWRSPTGASFAELVLEPSQSDFLTGNESGFSDVLNDAQPTPLGSLFGLERIFWYVAASEGLGTIVLVTGFVLSTGSHARIDEEDAIHFRLLSQHLQILLGNAALFADLRNERGQLERSEQRFRTLVENAPEGIGIIKGMQLVYINRSGAELAGIDDPRTIIGAQLTEFVAGAEAQRIQERLQAVRISGLPSAAPRLYRTVDAKGRGRAIEALTVPIEYRGEPAVLAFGRDVTERVEMQNRLAQADRLAALGTLAAGLSHEINNPLTYVTINLARMKKQLSDSVKQAGSSRASGEPPAPGDTEQLLRMLERAQQGVERVTGIVRDIQRFVRPPADEKRVISLPEALESALAIAGHAVGYRAQIVRRYGEAPAIFGSPSRVERLFINLIINAAQAFEGTEGRDNRIEVSILAAPESAVVEIADNGCGMSPETVERIFDTFYTTKPAGQGTGLGLAICKSIADELGARIEVESEPGKGSCFRVTLPAHGGKTAERNEAATPDRRRVSSGSLRVETGAAPAEKAKVGRLLLIDDERNVASAVKAFLDEDFEVEVAFSGSEGLEKIEAGGRFDAVLCDMAMPNMSGAQFYRKLAELDPDLADRTVLMTGILESALTELLGPDIRCPLLQKPFDPDEAKRLLVRLVKEGPQASD